MNALLSTLLRDKARYEPLGGIRRNLGFWMVATHRLQSHARTLASPLVRLPLLATCKAASLLWQSVWGVRLSEQAAIGPGFCLIHPRDVVVGRAHIGEDCLVFHEVTIEGATGEGATGEGGSGGPELGDHVDVYVGAKVLGDIRIGDDVKIGANCVVTNDVAPGCDAVVAAGRTIPASIVSAFGPRGSVSEASRSPSQTNHE
jgi:serine O-acetyltransferase